jgi:predicted alpha/beta superfamily hydrolase
VAISATGGVMGAQRDLKIVINTPFNTLPDEKIFLTGDLPGYCFWDPACIQMKQIGPNTFESNLTFDEDINHIEVKVTKGSWEREASDAWGNPFSNILINLNDCSDNLFVFNVVNWRDYGPLRVTGDVKKFFSVYSPQLDNFRDVYVWLPPGYDEKRKESYPVVYMHDGENVFDPRVSNYGVDWSVDEVMQELVKENEIRPAIVVAVFSRNRYEEYDYLLLGQAYSSFLVETVRPMINEKFNVSSDRKDTYLMGSSMGALISFTTMWVYPEVFSKAAGLSLPAFIHDQMIINFVEDRSRPKHDVSFYMDHGMYGIDSKYEKWAKDFYGKLLGSGIKKEDIAYEVFPYANHTEADWARRVHIPIKFLLAN